MPQNTGGGYNLNVLPQIQQVDPRLFTTGGQFIGGLNSGFSAYGALQNISDEAVQRPIKRQLANIQLADAQNRLSLAPLEQQLRLAQISEAQQNAATPRIVTGDITLEDGTQEYPAALDENGERTGPADRVVGDLVQVSQEQLVGPGGVLTPRTVRKTLKTAEQRAAEEAKAAAAIRATDALATDRLRGKEFESQQLIEGYNAALDEGDTDTAAIYKALIDRKSNPGLLQNGTTFRRRMEQNAADAGLTLEQATELSKTPAGMQALTAAAVANKAKAKSPFGAPTLSAEQQALISGSSPAVPAALPVQQRAEQILVPASQSAIVVRTKAERDVLPKGTRYIGPDGKEYIKN